MPKFIDLTSQRFGRLLVLARDSKSRTGGGATFLCRCDCGIECVTQSSNLRSGMSCSCGCRCGGALPNRPSVEELRRGYLKEGRTQAELADIYGCGRATMQDWLKQARVRCRKQGRPKKIVY